MKIEMLKNEMPEAIKGVFAERSKCFTEDRERPVGIVDLEVVRHMARAAIHVPFDVLKNQVIREIQRVEPDMGTAGLIQVLKDQAAIVEGTERIVAWAEMEYQEMNL
jgi:hypothetical protein